MNDWTIYEKFTPNVFGIYHNTEKGIQKTILFIHTFHVFTHRNLSEAQAFLNTHPTPDTLITVADKLRYYRFTHELLQKDIAEIVHICRNTYASYEDDARISYDIEVMKRIAEYYKIPVTNLLDDYNLFLYEQPGLKLKQLRKSYHITQKTLSEFMHVQRNTIMEWEKGYHTMSFETYHLLFKTDFIKSHLNSR